MTYDHYESGGRNMDSCVDRLWRGAKMVLCPQISILTRKGPWDSVAAWRQATAVHRKKERWKMVLRPRIFPGFSLSGACGLYRFYAVIEPQK